MFGGRVQPDVVLVRFLLKALLNLVTSAKANAGGRGGRSSSGDSADLDLSGKLGAVLAQVRIGEETDELQADAGEWGRGGSQRGRNGDSVSSASRKRRFRKGVRLARLAEKDDVVMFYYSLLLQSETDS